MTVERTPVWSFLVAAPASVYISDHLVVYVPSQKSDVPAQPSRLLLEVLKIAVGDCPKHLTGADQICVINNVNLGGFYL